MKLDDIKKVLVIGAGTMGQQIAFLCGRYGLDVALYDISDELLGKALARIKKISEQTVSAQQLKEEEAAAACARIICTTDPEEAGSDADIISESVPEDPKLKGKIFGQFNGICPEHTIFTTNTSTLLPSMFAEASGRPEKLLAFHFHDTRMTNIVDVMPHPGTSEETVEVVTGFAKKIGQNPIVLKKEKSGYVFNTMLSAWFESAEGLAANGIATVEDIDRAWMGVMQSLVGPFGVMDLVGLDSVWKINDFWAQKLESAKYRKIADYIKSYVETGKLGMKSGEGFYTYPDPAYGKPGFVAGK